MALSYAHTRISYALPCRFLFHYRILSPLGLQIDLYMMMNENAPPPAVWERAPASPCCFSPPFRTIHSLWAFGLASYLSFLFCSDFSVRAFNLDWPTRERRWCRLCTQSKIIIAFHMLSVELLFAFGNMVMNNKSQGRDAQLEFEVAPELHT